jgi:hypothetical protein
MGDAGPAPTVLFLTSACVPNSTPDAITVLGRTPNLAVFDAITSYGRHPRHWLGIHGPKAYSLAEVALKALTTADI